MGKLTNSNFGIVLPPNYIDGLILSNGTDTEHDINIATGFCTPPDEMLAIHLSSILTKQIDVNWAEGTDDGGFPSGLSIAADTWYHVFVISNDDGTKVDAGFDTSLTATNLLSDATDYTKYRRIGSVLTDASSNILGFHQYGDQFFWDSPPQDVSGSVTTTSALFTLSAPPGIRTWLNLMIYANRTDTTWACHFYSPDADDQAIIFGGDPPGAIMGFNTVSDARNNAMLNVKTNLSSQIRGRGGSTVSVKINTIMYVDSRGKE